jgi:N-acetylglucosaminyldiphosphoundecaprenol N-acetyl-beta-D-mannosaminyltransferase
MMQNLPLGHLKITTGDREGFVDWVGEVIRKKGKDFCVPLNLSKYVASKDDAKLRRVIRTAGLVIADGAPVCWLGRRLGYGDVRRVTGIELAEALLAQSRRRGWRIFLLGAAPAHLERAIGYLAREFDRPGIVGAHHGYFAPGDIEHLTAEINELNPDILLLGLGMPQKEYFIDDHLEEIGAHFWLPVGGAFDIWAQTKKRSNALVQKLGLEWLQRSLYNRSKALSVFRYGFVFLKDFLFTK